MFGWAHPLAFSSFCHLCVANSSTPPNISPSQLILADLVDSLLRLENKCKTLMKYFNYRCYFFIYTNYSSS